MLFSQIKHHKDVTVHLIQHIYRYFTWQFTVHYVKMFLRAFIRIIQNELYEINQETIIYTHTHIQRSRQKTIKVQQYVMTHVEQCQNCQ